MHLSHPEAQIHNMPTTSNHYVQQYTDGMDRPAPPNMAKDETRQSKKRKVPSEQSDVFAFLNLVSSPSILPKKAPKLTKSMSASSEQPSPTSSSTAGANVIDFMPLNVLAVAAAEAKEAKKKREKEAKGSSV